MNEVELRKIRKSMNLSQAALAQALGLTPQFIGMMERGEKPIEPRTAMSVIYLVDHPESRPDNDDVEVISMSQMFANYISEPKLYDGKQWGLWRLSFDSLTLDFDSKEVLVDRDEFGQDIYERREKYYIPLYEITDATSLANWIGQVARKKWGPLAVGNLVQALDDIFGIQSTFVYGTGFSNSEAAEEHLRGLANRES